MCRNLFLLTILLPISLLTRAQDIHFHTLGPADGLSQSSAISIWQDAIGRMWFGNDALNCYNGNNVTIYRLSEYFPEIEDSNIHSLCGDDNYLYCLAENELIIFDLNKEEFIRPFIHTKAIYCIEDKLYYTCNNTLLCFDTQTGLSNSVYTLPEENIITSILIDRKKICWLGTNRGICRIDLPNHALVLKELENEYVSFLYEDNHERVWVHCKSRHIYQTDEHRKLNLLSYETDQSSFPVLPGDSYCMIEDENGLFWIGTLNGIHLLQEIPEKKNKYKVKSTFLKETTVFDLYKDIQGTIWIGPYYGDVRFYNPKVDNYIFYPASEKYENCLHGVVLGSIVEDNTGNLYIATEGSGINVINKEGNISHIKAITHALPNDKIRTLFYDPADDRLYISVYMNGLYYLDLVSLKIFKIRDEYLLNNYQRIIEKIIPFNEELLLLTQDGIFKLNKKTREISGLFEENELRKLTSGIIRTIHVDKKDVLWVSSFKNGLFTIDLNTHKVLNFYGDGRSELSSLPSAVVDICNISENEIVFTTLKSGILKYSYREDKFINYTEKNAGLLSDICYNIRFSQKSNSSILTSNKGISLLKFNENEELLVTHNFVLSHHFPLQSLNADCGLFISDFTNDMFVGGLYGLLSFNEKDIFTLKEEYYLYFTSYSINGESFPFYSHKNMNKEIEKNILDLKYNENTISLIFSSSNYLSPHSTKYQYKLQGLDQYWIESDYNTITYHSLPPGKYELLIREQNNSEKQLTLFLHVHPPYWRSIPAIIFYIIVSLLVITIIIRFNKSKAALQLRLALEQRETERIEEYTKNKLDFFTNISNEFRIPLTIIITLLDRLTFEVPYSGKKKVERVKKQALYLHSLLNELIDFRKADENQLTLKISYVDFPEFLKDLHTDYIDYAIERGITLKLNHLPEKEMVWIDFIQLQKVFSNLIFLLIHITKPNGEIMISTRRKTNHLEVTLSTCDLSLNKEENEQLERIINKKNSKESLSFLPDNGFNLSFIKSIIELHKGKLEIKQINSGISLVVQLQTDKNHFNQKEIQATDHNLLSKADITLKEKFDIEKFSTPEELKNGDKKFKMLIIESNEEVRNSLIEVFSLLYEVSEARNQDEGYRKVLHLLPDIILCEISSEEIGGLELCKQLKSNIKTLQIPFIALTLYPSEGQEIESIQCGADGYFIKPFNVEALFLKCNSLVNNRNQIIYKYTNQKNVESIQMTTNIKDQQFLEAANRILEANLDNIHFDTTLWSKELGIGRTRLFNQIKNITGMTPNDYILHMKMNKSRILLTQNANLMIAEIGYLLGFSNPAYFSKCFKKQFGITPQEYRKNKISGNPTAE